MEIELTLPEEIAVMTLPGMAFFPQALLPLHIFEPRYRRMLRDALDTHRLFAVAGLDTAQGQEIPYRVATVGIVRACQKREDGTSNLLIQGLTRVEFTANLGEDPYRRMRIRPLASEPGGSEADNARDCAKLSRLLRTRHRLGGEGAEDLEKFLRGIEDPEVFVDLIAYNLCGDARLKQRLLETLNVSARLALLNVWARREVDSLRLRRRLQGRLPDEDIANN